MQQFAIFTQRNCARLCYVHTADWIAHQQAPTLLGIQIAGGI
jgi:hypothetical protein